MRSVIRFIALFLLTFVGSVEGVRMAMAPAIQACACGCGAPSDDLCGCKGPAQPKAPVQPTAPLPGPKPCSEPTNGCSTNTRVNPGMVTLAKEGAEEQAKDPTPTPEPRPWPLQVALHDHSARVIGLVGSATDSLASPPWRCLQRLAWLSVFRN